MSTRLEKLILAYPSAPWNWVALSMNPCISFQFIQEHSRLPWVSKYVSRNESVYELDVIDNLNYAWDYESLCMNPNMSIEFFNKYIIKPDEVRRIDWQHLSANPAIGLSDILKYANYNWDDRYLSANPNLTSNFVINNSRDWFVPFISSNPGITARDIFKSTLKGVFEWDYKNLSANINLPIVYVNDHIEYDWNYHTISTHASLTDIELYRKIDWDGHGLSMNPNITFEYVKKHKLVKWHLPTVMANAAIDLSEIDMNWVRTNWSDSKSIESYLSSNPSITSKWIERNQRSLSWERLSLNQLK